MKLYVDDIRNAPNGDWHVARTVNEAIRAIASRLFSEISLDHDISHQVTVNELSRPYPCDETFQAVTYFIGEKYTKNRQNPIPVITIHSANPVGADKMKDILASYEIGCTIQLGKPVNRLEEE